MAINVSPRNRQISEERIKGKTYSAIGKQFDLSGERVRQICIKVGRQVRWGSTLRCLNCWYEWLWSNKVLFRQRYRYTCPKCGTEHGIYQNNGYHFPVANMRVGIR